MTFNYYFKWKVIQECYKIAEEVKSSLINSELDLQYLIIDKLKEFFKDPEYNGCGSSLCIMNCFYLGLNLKKDFKKIYPDLLIFIDEKLEIIIELKFFRNKRTIKPEEIRRDLEKLDKIQEKLNKDIDNEIDKAIALEIIIDTNKNNEEIVEKILTLRNNTIILKSPIQEKIYHSAIIYKKIIDYRNLKLNLEIERIKNLLNS